MSAERSIPDVWQVFGQRRNSWQKMMTDEEKTITELFHDLHIHAAKSSTTCYGPDGAVVKCKENSVAAVVKTQPPYADDCPTTNNKCQNSNAKKRVTDERNERNSGVNGKVSNEWESIEKHLSMKKTIRKKMMRDLQQAFIDADHQQPNESPQQWDRVQMANGPSVQRRPTGANSAREPNLLDMLKDDANVPKQLAVANCDAKNSTTDATTKKNSSNSFWKKFTIRRSSKR